MKYCDDDQEALGGKIEDWQTKSPKSNFFYRTREAVINEKDEPRPRTPEETLLFVHQELWQQQMLERYGSEPALMDATYKTTRCTIPLFFVCVHTKVGHKVVAEFMCQSEDQASISEALAIIKGWNPAWNPAYLMVDYSKSLPSNNNSLKVWCTFLISIDYKQCTTGPSQNRMAFRLLSRRYF